MRAGRSITLLAVVAVASAGVTAAVAAPAGPGAVMPVKLAIKLSVVTKATTGKSVGLSFTKTVVPRGDKVTSYTVTYGDGSKKVTGKGVPKGLSHTYAKAGTFSIKASITDAHKVTSSVTDKIEVRKPVTVTVPAPVTAPVVTTPGVPAPAPPAPIATTPAPVATTPAPVVTSSPTPTPTASSSSPTPSPSSSSPTPSPSSSSASPSPTPSSSTYAYSLGGLVTSNGTPVSGVPVWIGSLNDDHFTVRTTTDSQGRYSLGFNASELNDPEDDSSVFLDVNQAAGYDGPGISGYDYNDLLSRAAGANQVKSSFGGAFVDVAVASGANNQDVSLGAPHAFTGRLVDPNGQGTPGVAVALRTFSNPSNPNATNIPYQTYVATDPQGNFTLPDVGTGTYDGVEALPASTTLSGDKFQGANNSKMTFKAVAAAELKGQLTVDGPATVQHVTVAVDPSIVFADGYDPEAIGMTTPDASGNYDLAHLAGTGTQYADGTDKIAFLSSSTAVNEPAGQYQQVKLTAGGTTTKNVHLAVGTQVKVTVLGPDGQIDTGYKTIELKQATDTDSNLYSCYEVDDDPSSGYGLFGGVPTDVNRVDVYEGANETLVGAASLSLQAGGTVDVTVQEKS